MDEKDRNLVEDTSLTGQIEFVRALLQTLETGEFSIIHDENDLLVKQVRAIYLSLLDLKSRIEA